RGIEGDASGLPRRATGSSGRRRWTNDPCPIEVRNRGVAPRLLLDLPCARREFYGFWVAALRVPGPDVDQGDDVAPPLARGVAVPHQPSSCVRYPHGPTDRVEDRLENRGDLRCRPHLDVLLRHRTSEIDSRLGEVSIRLRDQPDPCRQRGDTGCAVEF